MREKVTTITDEIGKLIDRQIELLNKRPFQDLTPDEVDGYQSRRDRIRRLCSSFLKFTALLALSRFMSFRQECVLLLRLGFELRVAY
jgi:hypothetical protein